MRSPSETTTYTTKQNRSQGGREGGVRRVVYKKEGVGGVARTTAVRFPQNASAAVAPPALQELCTCLVPASTGVNTYKARPIYLSTCSFAKRTPVEN